MWADGFDDTRARFARRDWERIRAADLAQALAVPSMLSLAESQLYHWCGRQAQGFGATVDLGAFAGGSAARLLSGLMHSGQPFHLHAYDRFTAGPRPQANFLADQLEPSGKVVDILALAQANLAPWQDHVSFHPGDIGDMAWTGGPIEILAYDAGKDAATSDHIATQFFPALVPGRSLILHQDFLRPDQPWLAAQAIRLAGHLHPLARVDKDCLVFLWTKAATPADLAAAATAGLTDDDLVARVHQAGQALTGMIEPAPFRRMERRIRANPGKRADWQLKPPKDPATP